MMYHKIGWSDAVPWSHYLGRWYGEPHIGCVSFFAQGGRWQSRGIKEQEKDESMKAKKNKAHETRNERELVASRDKNVPL